jgi:hypothetical protein
MNPTSLEKPPRARSAATALRRKPSEVAASCTRSRVAAATLGSPLSTRDAVFRLTPAASATMASVGRRFMCQASRRLRTSMSMMMARSSTAPVTM